MSSCVCFSHRFYFYSYFHLLSWHLTRVFYFCCSLEFPACSPWYALRLMACGGADATSRNAVTFDGFRYLVDRFLSRSPDQNL
jgi:hypothetical protein